MSDILTKAALDYNQLKSTMYEIVLGRKGRIYTIMLHFPSETFYHLAGLQHLRERILYLSLIPTMIENNSVTYLINRNEYVKYTSIQADYLFEYPHENNFIMYFFVIYEGNPHIGT